VAVKYAKDVNGNFVGQDSTTSGITQAELDAQTTFANASRIDAYTAEKIKGNANLGSPTSAGVLTALSKVGVDINSKVGNNIATIDAQTRSARLANQQDVAAKKSTDAFNKSLVGQFWSGVKGTVRGVSVIGGAGWEALNAGYRNAFTGVQALAGNKEAEAKLKGQNPLLAGGGIINPAETKQVTAGQVFIKALKDISHGNLPKVETGVGFFPSEETGAGMLARQASLNAAKIAVKDSTGKIIGYQPRVMFGDAASEILTLGHPENSAGQVISAVADIGASFYFDPQLARAKQIKALAKAATQARATGAMAEAAKIDDRVTKLKDAQTAVVEARDAALKQMDDTNSAQLETNKLVAKGARDAWQGKNVEAIKASKGVQIQQNRVDDLARIMEERAGNLDAAKKELADAKVAIKTPDQLGKLQAELAKAKATVKELKDKSTTIVNGEEVLAKSVRLSASDTVKSLTTKIKELSALPPEATDVNRIPAAKAALEQAIKDFKEVKDAHKGMTSELKVRMRNAKLTAKAQDIAATEYVKRNSRLRQVSAVLADKTTKAEQKQKIWADALEKLSGLKTVEGDASFSYQKIADFLTGGHGNAPLNHLVEMSDWKQIWRASKGKINSELAQQLAAAKSTDEVLNAIAPFLKRGDLAAGMLKPSKIETLGANLSEKMTPIADNLQFLLPAAKVLTGVGARVGHRMPLHNQVASLFHATVSGSRKLKDFASKEYKTQIKSGAFINIHDTEELLHAVDGFGTAVGLNKVELDKLIEKIATAPTASVRGYTASVDLMKAVFAQHAGNIPEKLQKQFKEVTTAFKDSNEKMASYWATRHINGAYLDYVDLAGKKIRLPNAHLESELLNSTVYLPSASEVLKLTSKLSKMHLGWTTKVGDKLISDYWKKMQLVRPAFVVRNIAEEQLRVFGTGHISLFNNPLMAISMWMGRPEGNKLRRVMYQMDQHRNNIFDKNFTTGSDIEDVLNETAAHDLTNSYVNIMSADHAGSFDDRAIKVLPLKNLNNVGPGHERFFDGIANQLRVLNSDAMARVVAGVKVPEIENAVKAGAKREDAVIDYFLSGGGRKALEERVSASSEDFKNFMYTRDGIKQYLYTGLDPKGKDISVLARILETTGGNSALREIVANGKVVSNGVLHEIPRPFTSAVNSITNAKQIKKGRKALLDSQADFANSIKDTFSGAGKWDDVVVNVPSRNAAHAIATDKPGMVKSVVDGFFDISTQLEKNSTFGPEFRQSYWDAINDIAKALNPEAKAQLATVAEHSLKPLLFRGKNIGEKHPIWSAFNAAEGKGTMSIEDAHIYADNVARNHVKELFYNANSKRLVFHQLRLIAPFANAWEDTIHKWAKIGLEDPIQVYKGIKSLNWLSNPASSSLYQLTDAKDYYNPNQGFFFSDPETGQQMFWVPFVGTVMAKLAGGLTGNNYKGAPIAFATNPMSFNFALGAGSILPGVGPGVTLPLSAFATWQQGAIDNMPEGIKNWLFPFGRSDFSSGLQSAILPANWQKIVGPILGQKDTYASTFKPVMQYLAGGANYNLDDPNDQAALAKNADHFARWVSIMRGIVGMVSPSSLQPKGLATDGNGDAMTQFTLYKDFQDMVVNNNGDYNKAVGDFLDTYGATAVFAIISSTTGNGPSNLDSYKFVTKHPDVVTKYGDIWSYVMPGGGLSQEMYRWNLVHGTKQKLTPAQMIEKANNLRFYAAKDMILAKVDAGIMDKASYNAATNQLKLSMNGGPKSSTDFNKFSRVIFQLKSLTEDNRFSDVPAVAGLRDYLYLRDTALAKLNKTSTDKLAGTGTVATQQRAWLSEQAVWIIKDNPDFQKIFYQFFANELEGK